MHKQASPKEKPQRLPQKGALSLKVHFQRYFWLYVFVLPVVIYYIIFLTSLWAAL